jgi:transcriptional regulator with XRE-family HTH domain
VAADVRRHFALTQAELARWLRVSPITVAAVENGRRELSARPDARLGRLHSLLALAPVAPPESPAEPEPPTPAQAAADARTATLLARRARRCRHLAAQLAFQIDTWALQDAALLRRRQGLAALRAGLAAPPAYLDPLAPPDPAAEAAWLARLEAVAPATRPSALARAHAALRLRLLLAEAEGLEALA